MERAPAEPSMCRALFQKHSAIDGLALVFGPTGASSIQGCGKASPLCKARATAHAPVFLEKERQEGSESRRPASRGATRVSDRATLAVRRWAPTPGPLILEKTL